VPVGQAAAAGGLRRVRAYRLRDLFGAVRELTALMQPKFADAFEHIAETRLAVARGRRK